MQKLSTTAIGLLIDLLRDGFILTNDFRFAAPGKAVLIRIGEHNHVDEAWVLDWNTADHYENGFISEPVEYEFEQTDKGEKTHEENERTVQQNR